ncbi:MAG: DNA topoisomerase 1 [Actinobacteria bacterium]|uniref:DNA topoisomerase 1 n=3 Tax=Candidatus Hakubella thermalkaliphila TaxID=2754717 RepID=A0A6V8Q6K5_9ACTN|nr:DNA topoisomerase I [Candidatus Hakubella thermalkaliphila]MBT9171321.1 DNA topoisomerase 1 [Actinomycetota bacterium]GFP39714.1 DNA topoisomerase I [Candidatus Hakubella thermalkaliphila]
MKLIVCEKDLAARRIADILSGGTNWEEKSHTIPIYKFSQSGEEFRILGLKGHILQVDYPEEYNNWWKVEPRELIFKQLVKVPINKNVINALKKAARDAHSAIIATDFDREGELIGMDAVGVIREVNPGLEIKRARYSAITRSEIQQTFQNLEEPYEHLAEAGRARQEIDLIWGAVLTRFISLTSTRLWDNFLSVGRVQSPTLVLLVQRELEIRDFKPTPYWQIKVRLKDGGEEFEAFHKTRRFLRKEEAEEVFARLGEEGLVTSIREVERKKAPPAPMNTTVLLSSAAKLGLSPASAMNIAEGLYMRGLISYPRVDNTVFPASIDIRGVLLTLKASPQFRKMAEELIASKRFVPTRGKKQSTDHPPIYPTDGASKEKLSPQEWKVYDLVTRHFLATLAEEALQMTMQVDIDISGEPFYISGSRIVREGWLRYLPYFKSADVILPQLKEGEKVQVLNKEILAKETQPPPRYTQGRLVEKMEELGLGTKSTRHSIIKSLYDRGYVVGNPLVPRETGIAVASTLIKHAQKISSPEMTAELEQDMDRIVEGLHQKDQVVGRSREMLDEIMEVMEKEREEIAADIRNGVREDEVVGKCRTCGKDLRIKRARKSRKRFVGCSGYPQCTEAYPLPQKGKIRSTDEVCPDCGTLRITVINKGRRPWKLCLDPECPTKKELVGSGRKSKRGEN